MTIPDLIDQELRSIGANPKTIEEARQFSLAVQCTTQDSKDQVMRELAEHEIEHYRNMIRLYFLAVLVSPEFRDQIRKEIKEQLNKN